jgi:hypothetical protein
MVPRRAADPRDIRAAVLAVEPWLRDEAEKAGVNVLNKPVKPAALRALLAQWRATRVAAE